MELETNHNASVLNDASPKNNSRLGPHSGLPKCPTSAAVSSSSLFLTIPGKKTGLLDDVRSTSGLDAMKSSSPTHMELPKDSALNYAYRNWMVRVLWNILYVMQRYQLFLWEETRVSEVMKTFPSVSKHLKTLVSFGKITDEQKATANSFDLEIYSWDEFLHLGISYEFELPAKKKSDICTIMYTSGTTGDPKGVMITNESII